MNLAILMCPNPVSTDWELPPGGVLLGWIFQPESFDGGAAWPVRNLLSQIFCRTGMVTYLAHDGVPVRGSKHRIVTTREPKIVAALFDDPAYPWTQHGQAVLLSDETVPEVSAKLLTEVAGHQRVDAAERAGFHGVLLPGVDGAVAGLWMFDPAALVAFAAEMRATAELHVLSEDEFREAMASE